MEERIIQISKTTGIPTKKIWDMFFLLKNGKPIDNNKLLQKLGVSKNALNQVKELLSNLLETPSNFTNLKRNETKIIQSLFDSKYRTEEELWSYFENTEYINTLNFLKIFENKKPPSDRKYDQFTATIETTARRVALMEEFGDIAGKRLLFLGDDDFTSISTAKTNKASEVTVLDIDARIIEIINKIRINEKLSINVENYDARKTLAAFHQNRYDVVFSDPPYTSEGIKLFTSRAIKALDLSNQSARIYLCFGNSDRAKERFLPIYNIFESSGLMIRWVFDKFNRYKGAESIGSTSSLFILDTTSKTKPLVTGNYDKKIYTNN